MITVRVQFKVSVFVKYFCCASVMILLCCYYAAVMILLCYKSVDVNVLLCFCYTSIETTEKNDDNSESMSTPNTKINQAVGREGQEDELGSDRNDEGLSSII